MAGPVDPSLAGRVLIWGIVLAAAVAVGVSKLADLLGGAF